MRRCHELFPHLLAGARAELRPARIFDALLPRTTCSMSPWRQEPLYSVSLEIVNALSGEIPSLNVETPDFPSVFLKELSPTRVQADYRSVLKIKSDLCPNRILRHRKISSFSCRGAVDFSRRNGYYVSSEFFALSILKRKELADTWTATHTLLPFDYS